MRWRNAMEHALYGTDGFFTDAVGPAGHFRTSVHASPIFAGAILRLLVTVDEALGHPDPFDVVDIGAGRGELLTGLAALTAQDAGDSPPSDQPHPPAPILGDAVAVPGEADGDGSAEEWTELADRAGFGGSAAAAPAAPAPEVHPPHGPLRGLARRIRFTGVEKAARPDALPDLIGWRGTPPERVTGLIVATEWLDNVPLDIAEVGEDGDARVVHVDPATGAESPGPRVDAADRFWLARWWPLDGTPPGTRAEIGWTRDAAWAAAVSTLDRGLALAVDYGHRRGERPAGGTLTGYRDGRQVQPVPDGSTDVTAHVAMDAIAAAGGHPYSLVTQREALAALGVDGGRPAIDLAHADPAGYVRALAAAGAAAELTDPAGLGGHWWLLQTVGIDLHGRIPA